MVGWAVADRVVVAGWEQPPPLPVQPVPAPYSLPATASANEAWVMENSGRTTRVMVTWAVLAFALVSVALTANW
jgi:hypothetical protein